MSLTRTLGMMIASRMGGRGRGRGALGTAAMLGGLAGRRGLGGKLGLAALGYMAYRAYKNHQAQSANGAGAGRPARRPGSAE